MHQPPRERHLSVEWHSKQDGDTVVPANPPHPIAQAFRVGLIPLRGAKSHGVVRCILQGERLGIVAPELRHHEFGLVLQQKRFDVGEPIENVAPHQSGA
jgi:hypothetical protein